jgi:hypothetical protein
MQLRFFLQLYCLGYLSTTSGDPVGLAAATAAAAATALTDAEKSGDTGSGSGFTLSDDEKATVELVASALPGTTAKVFIANKRKLVHPFTGKTAHKLVLKKEFATNAKPSVSNIDE